MRAQVSLLSRLLPFLRERGYQAGDRIPSERELAQRFGLSRSYVREALAVLEATRLVERRPQSGVYLRASRRDAGLDVLLMQHDAGLPLTAEDVHELYEFRVLIEMQSIEMAVERRTEEDLRRIDAVLEESAERLAQGLPLADQDAQFHLALLEAAHNQFLVRTANWFYLISGSRRETYFKDPAHGRKSLSEHKALRDALRDSDRKRAVELMGKHMRLAERYWLSTLKPGPRRAARKYRP